MDLRIIVTILVLAALAGPAHPYGGGGGAPVAADDGKSPKEAPVVKDLAKAVKEEKDPDIRNSAAVSLGQFPRDPRASATLTRVTTDSAQDPQLRATAAVSLGNQGVSANAPALVSALDDADPFVRRHAVLGLGMLKATDRANDVARRLDDSDGAVRRAAARALAFAGSPKARAALEKSALSDDDAVVRLESLRTLLQTGNATRRLARRLANHDRDPEVRELAAAAKHALPRDPRDRKNGEEDPDETADDAVGPPSPAPGAPDVAPTPAASVAGSPATTAPGGRRKCVKLKHDDDEESLTDFSEAPSAGISASREADSAVSVAPARSSEGDGAGHSTSPATTPSAAAFPKPSAGAEALTSTTALPRTTGTANGESGRAIPGEPLAGAIQRLARRLAPGAASDDEQLRTMHELAPLIDQAASLGSRTVPLAPIKGRWFLTAHRKISEHEPLVKTTFVNEQGALFRADSKQPHLPGSTYVVFRYKDVAGKAGELNGIGAYTYTREGTPVFKHFGLDGTLDTFSTRETNAETCFRCHDNRETLTHSKDFTFDTFQKAKANGTLDLMEKARTKVAESK